MIPEKLTYFFVDFFTILFPFVFSFTSQFDFKKYWKYFFPVNLVVAILYIIWDIFYTKIGVWGFNHKYTLGWNFMGLPIEEIMFFICIPYACIFTYYCFRKFVFPLIKYNGRIWWLILSITFLIIGAVHSIKLYTAAAFISCSASFILAYVQNKNSFFHFLLFYGVILIPFFITNGVLTGSFLDRVVVFYNDSENLGIRIMTIPMEDIFYGMAMLHFNVLGFEYLLSKNNKDK